VFFNISKEHDINSSLEQFQSKLIELRNLNCSFGQSDGLLYSAGLNNDTKWLSAIESWKNLDQSLERRKQHDQTIADIQRIYR
jgi:hypothetical protein